MPRLWLLLIPVVLFVSVALGGQFFFAESRKLLVEFSVRIYRHHYARGDYFLHHHDTGRIVQRMTPLARIRQALDATAGLRVTLRQEDVHWLLERRAVPVWWAAGLCALAALGGYLCR